MPAVDVTASSSISMQYNFFIFRGSDADCYGFFFRFFIADGSLLMAAIDEPISEIDYSISLMHLNRFDRFCARSRCSFRVGCGLQGLGFGTRACVCLIADDWMDIKWTIIVMSLPSIRIRRALISFSKIVFV